MRRTPVRAKFADFLERHPRPTVVFVAAILGFITVSTITGLVRSHATVHAGWGLAVGIGLALPMVLIALEAKGLRRPYSALQLLPALGLGAFFLFGFIMNEAVIFGAWARNPYTVTSAFQTGTLALAIPTEVVLTALMMLAAVGAIVLRRPRHHGHAGPGQPSA